MSTVIDLISDHIDVDIDTEGDVVTIVVTTPFTVDGKDKVKLAIQPEMVAEAVNFMLFSSKEMIDRRKGLNVTIHYDQSHIHPSVTATSVTHDYEALKALRIVSGYSPEMTRGICDQANALLDAVPVEHRPYTLYGAMMFCLPLSYTYAQVIINKLNAR